MELFTNWITQIIIFMLFATIFEMLLPENQMKKYVHLILGLLLLLMLSKPILFLFNTNIETVMLRMEQTMTMTDHHYGDIKNEINQQKNEIDLVQAAYIWTEVASQMKKDANNSLKGEGYKLSEVTLDHDNHQLLNIQCTISKTQSQKIEKEKKPIDIQMKDPYVVDELNVSKTKVKNTLAEIWDVEPEIIKIEWGGGKN